MTVWTTTHLPEREQFAYWREVLCEAFVTLRPEREAVAGGISSEVTGRTLSALNVTTVSSQRQRVYRERAEMAKAQCEHYFLNLQVEGACRVVTQGREALVRPGEFALVDTTQPYLLDCCADRWTIHSFRIPHHLLQPRLPHVSRMMGLRVGREGALNAVLMSFLDAVVANAKDVPEEKAPELAGELLNLLTLTLTGTGEETSEDGSVRGTLLTAISKHIDLHIADPGLSPASVAARFRISLRYLHKLFEGQALSFAETVVARRLECCARDLAGDADARIADIAYRWGFNDLSQFNRRFRAAFGQTPRDYRAGSRDLMSGTD